MIFRQHTDSIYGFVRLLASFVCLSKKNLCVRSLGYIVGASPPRVCPFIGRQSSLDPCMPPTPLSEFSSNIS